MTKLTEYSFLYETLREAVRGFVHATISCDEPPLYTAWIIGYRELRHNCLRPLGCLTASYSEANPKGATMHIYCLFCLVSHVPVVRKVLDHSFSCEVLQASILQRKWIKGTPTDEPHDYLPGYLFIYSEEPITDTYTIRNLEGVIRFLKYESCPDYELHGSDRTFAEALYKENGQISYVPVYEVGERLEIKDGLFQGQQAEIKKVDRRKQRLLLEFTFDNTSRTIWLGYDVVKEDINRVGQTV